MGALTCHKGVVPNAPLYNILVVVSARGGGGDSVIKETLYSLNYFNKNIIDFQQFRYKKCLVFLSSYLSVFSFFFRKLSGNPEHGGDCSAKPKRCFCKTL